jgi:hypothetical protein
MVEGLLYSFPYWTLFLDMAGFRTVVADDVITGIEWTLVRFRCLRQFSVVWLFMLQLAQC